MRAVHGHSETRGSVLRGRRWRAAYFFFDLTQPSDIPSIAEPFFSNLRAAIDVTPAMNIEDVRAGLGALKM